MPHKAFLIAEMDTTKEKVQKNLNDNDIRCVVLEEDYESSTGYTNYTVLVDDHSFYNFFDKFREPADIRSHFILRLGVELDLMSKTMYWFNDEDEYFFSMDVWLHEESKIAFVDKKGTICVRDLDIEIPGYEIKRETFEPREA